MDGSEESSSRPKRRLRDALSEESGKPSFSRTLPFVIGVAFLGLYLAVGVWLFFVPDWSRFAGYFEVGIKFVWGSGLPYIANLAHRTFITKRK